VSAPPATAAAPMCQGQPATVVGEPGAKVVKGTPGDDVIFARQAFEVRALGGDDLICATIRPKNPHQTTGKIRAGAGDDSVVVQTSADDYVWTELGPGADTFVGGDETNIVWAGTAQDGDDEGAADADDADKDVISTAGGYDLVFLGEPGAPLADVLDTGADFDEVQLQAVDMTDEAELDLGAGHDLLFFSWPSNVRGDWSFDNANGVAADDSGRQLSWARVESFQLPGHAVDRLDFTGGRKAESLTAGNFGTLDLGGGNDQLTLVPTDKPRNTETASKIIAGRGRDRLVVDDQKSYRVDLDRGRVRFQSKHQTSSRLAGFEDVRAFAWGDGRAVVIGSDGPNKIGLIGCRVLVRAGGGNDLVTAVHSDDRCGERTLRGGDGRDDLRGGAGPDRLYGGGGRDRLDGLHGQDHGYGGAGADLCRVEIELSCTPF